MDALIAPLAPHSATLIPAAAAALALLLFLWLRAAAGLRGARAALASAEARAAEARVDAARLDEIAHARDAATARAEARETALEAELRALRAAHDVDRARLTELRAARTAEAEAHAEKIEQLVTLREDLDDRFEALARAAFDRSHAALDEKSGARLAEQLGPLKTQIERFEAELRGVHQGAAQDRARLKTEIEQLTRRSEAISKEAVSLTEALRGDKRRQGAWGEMILASILERSGLRGGEEYVTQAHRVTEDGARLRPDVVVHLPGGRSLVVDSKVSLTAYEQAVAAADAAERDRHAARHLAAVRRHIDGLGAKAYHALEEGSPDYVVMFIPIEGAFAEALRMDGELSAYALERGVAIATPATLMLALRTVESVWAIERRSRNAEAIAERAGRLYDKMALFAQSMARVGEQIDRAANSHREAMGRLSEGPGNILRQFESLRELGARSGRRIEADFDPDQPGPTPLESSESG